MSLCRVTADRSGGPTVERWTIEKSARARADKKPALLYTNQPKVHELLLTLLFRP